MWFFQTQNYLGLKFGQMAIFRVLRQKHVVFPNSKLFGAEIRANGDFPGASSETCGFSEKTFSEKTFSEKTFSKLKIILG